ncbi:PucR family transcriptional regulator [Actinomycetes bacterium M1A6_2h]
MVTLNGSSGGSRQLADRRRRVTPFEFLTEWSNDVTTRSVRGGAEVNDTDLVAVRAAASEWVACGVSVDSALEACRESGTHVLTRWMNDDGSEAASASRAVVALVSAATRAIGDEYALAAGRGPGGSSTRDELARALILGRPRWPELAMQLGVDIPARYHVMVVRIPDAISDRRSAVLNDAIDATFGTGHDVLVAIDRATVTILVPLAGDDPSVDRLSTRLDRSFGGALLGASVEAANTDLRDAAGFANELLALAAKLGRPSKIYRTQDLVLEYQMSRPGPGRQVIGTVLDPLRDRPVLLETITAYMKSQQSRRSTSRKLYIHNNTLDSRLKKISELLGFDISEVAGQRKLEAAIFIDDLDRYS